MNLQIFTSADAFDVLGDAWNGLLQQSATNTLFLTREWQQVWWQGLGDGALHVLTLRDDDGTLVGIAPLFIEENSLGAKQINLVGCKEVSDYLDFIFAKGHERECFETVLNYLDSAEAPEWDTISLCNVPETSPTQSLLMELAQAHGWKSTSVFEDVCPIIDLPKSFDDYLAMLDGKERRELQRKLRRATEDTQVVISADGSKLDADIGDFLRLMRASMFSKNDFMTPRMEKFFYMAARAMFNAGYLQLSFLEVNGERAATYLNFLHNKQVLVYNSGLDPAKFSYLSPGQVLIARLIEKAISDGFDKFDFLQGNEDYKYKLGGKDIKLYTLGVTRA